MTQEAIRTSLKYYMKKIADDKLTVDEAYKMFMHTNKGLFMKLTTQPRNRKPRITELILEGLPAGVIALRVGCTPSNVYNVRARLIKEARIGRIEPKDKDMTPYKDIINHKEYTVTTEGRLT